MALAFTKAVRTQSKARIALGGPSGSGKTYTALLLAKAMGSRIALIDSESGSSTKYAGEEEMPDFDVLALQTFSPELYIEAIHAAEKAGYDVLIIDSLTHAWSGKEGVLEQVDLARMRSASKNAFTDGWRIASPMHTRLVDTIIRAKLHVIATMRSKTDYVLDDVDGRKVPRKVGMAMVQRDGTEYEFDIVGELTQEHRLVITKSRCRDLADKVFDRPGEELGRTILQWLSAGADTRAEEPQRRSTTDAGEILDHAIKKLNHAREEPADVAAEAEEKSILLEKIAMTIKEMVPGQEGADKRRRIEIMFQYFNVGVWSAIEKLEIAPLREGFRQLQEIMRPTVETHQQESPKEMQNNMEAELRLDEPVVEEMPTPDVDADGEVTHEWIKKLIVRADLHGTQPKLREMRRQYPAMTASQWQEVWRAVGNKAKGIHLGQKVQL